jgi:hypothetical protein
MRDPLRRNLETLKRLETEEDRLKAELHKIQRAKVEHYQGMKLDGNNPFWCGDGGCILLVPGVPVGQHTNGGCRCLGSRLDPKQRVRVRSGINWLRQRIKNVYAGDEWCGGGYHCDAGMDAASLSSDLDLILGELGMSSYSDIKEVTDRISELRRTAEQLKAENEDLLDGMDL